MCPQPWPVKCETGLWPLGILVRCRLLRGSRGKLLLGESDQSLKPRRVLDRHIRQDLPVQEDIRFLQGIDKLAVGQSMRPNCRIDARNPQHTEIPFPFFPPGVGVGLTLVDRFSCGAEEPALPSILSFG